MGVSQKGCFNLGEEDTILPVVPMFHANSWGLPYASGMAGAKLVFPDRWMGDGAVLLDLCQTEGVTVLAGVPTIWINFLRQVEQANAHLPAVHTVISGGSAIPP